MIIYFVILAAAALRFIPHTPNFAPITALAIFSAVYLPKKQAIIIPLAARLISDIFIDAGSFSALLHWSTWVGQLKFLTTPLMLSVYSAHLVGVLFGLWIRKSPNHKWLKVISSSLGSSIIFFMVTNSAFLYKDYGHNFSGIILAYTNGLPFLRGTVLGDLAYTVGLFGGYALVLALKKPKQKTFAISSN